MTDTKIKRIDYDDHPEFATGQVWSQAEMKWIEAALEAARQEGYREAIDSNGLEALADCEELHTKLQVATDELTRTAKSIDLQLELITERAKGDFLDKRPVVQILTSHAKRARSALAKIKGEV